MARRDEGGYPQRSLTEEQRSQPAFSAKTLRAAGILSVACVGSDLTARCGDARSSPSWPRSKSLAAGPHAILKQALRLIATVLVLVPRNWIAGVRGIVSIIINLDQFHVAIRECNDAFSIAIKRS